MRMTKKEIEQQLTKLARLRWDYIRGLKKYRNDFYEYINIHPEQKNNPLIFEEFIQEQTEDLDEFAKRIEQKKSIDKKFRHPPPSFKFRSNWRLWLPVHYEVPNPNPFSLLSLKHVRRPIEILGRHSFHVDRKHHRSKTLFKFIKQSAKDPIELDNLLAYSPRIVTDLISEDNPHHKDSLKSQKIVLEIDLNQKVETIKFQFNEILNYYRSQLLDTGIIMNRKIGDDEAKAIKVYHLREEEKRDWKYIAKKFFPRDFMDPEVEKDPDPDKAKVQVHQYYKRAKDLIKDVL